MWTTDRMRPLLFHRLLSQHPASPTPESPSRLLFRFFAASMAFALAEKLGSLLFPSRANISTLQDSLYVAGCCFALPSQEVTSLQHNQSPGCTGCLLCGLLTVTTTGLSPVSRRQLTGHTIRRLGYTNRAVFCGSSLTMHSIHHQ